MCVWPICYLYFVIFSVINCGTITAIASLFIHQCIMFIATIIYTFYGKTTFGLYGARISLTVWRHFTWYLFYFIRPILLKFVLSMKNKYTVASLSCK